MHAPDPTHRALLQFRNCVGRIIGQGWRIKVSTARCLTCAVVAVAISLSLVACVGLIFVFYGGSRPPPSQGLRAAGPDNRSVPEAPSADGADDDGQLPVAATSGSALCLARPSRSSDKWRLIPRSNPADVAKGVWYAVDDGCALGHMPKDVATIAAAAVSPGQRRVDGIVFLHPCATREAWRGGDGAKPSLFRDVLAPLFKGGLRNLLRGHAESDFAEGNAGVVAFAASAAAADSPRQPLRCFERVLWRSPHARWFGAFGTAASSSGGGVAAENVRENLLVANAISEDSRRGPAEGCAGSSSKLRVVLVDRGGSSTRRWANVTGLATELGQAFGHALLNGAVTVARLEAMPLRQQVSLLAEADVVVAVHGAALSLAVLAMRRGGTAGLVEVFPPGFRYLIFEEGARSAGIQYAGVDGAVAGPGVTGKCSAAACPSSRFRVGPWSSVAGPGYLRGLNGRSQCKNCDVAWAGAPGVVDAVGAMVRSVFLGWGAAGYCGFTARDIDRRA